MSTRSTTALWKLISRVLGVQKDSPIDLALQNENYTEVGDLHFIEEPDIGAWRYIPVGKTEDRALSGKDRKMLQLFVRWARQKVSKDLGHFPDADEWDKLTKDDYIAYVENLGQAKSVSNQSSTPSTTSTPVTTPSVPKSTNIVSDFKKSVKKDVQSFSKFEEDKFWDAWKMSVEAQARAQDLEDVLQPTFVPVGTDETALFAQKQNYMFAVFLYTVKTGAGRAIVKKHHLKGDAQQVWKDLVEHYTSSTTSKLRSDQLMKYITNARLDDSWRRTSVDFIRHWAEQIRLFEEITSITSHMSDDLKRTMLENALVQVRELQFVSIQDRMNVTKGGTPLTFQQYYDAVHDAAVLRDTSLSVSSRNRRRIRANLHDLGLDDLYEGYEDDDEPSDNEELGINIHDLRALVANRKPPDKGRQGYALEKGKQNMRDSKRTYIPPEMWEQLDEKAKAILLGRALPSGDRRANLHDLDQQEEDQDDNGDDGEDQDDAYEPEDPGEDINDDQDDSRELSAFLTGRKSLAPNDIRRVLAASSRPIAKKKKPKSRTVRIHDVTYTVSASHRKDSVSSLIDRGCNGGMAGSDVMWVEECADKISATVT